MGRDIKDNIRLTIAIFRSVFIMLTFFKVLVFKATFSVVDNL